MSINKYIIIDTEHGGNVNLTLLQASFIVIDNDFNILDMLDLPIKPDDGKYMVLSKSMEVNKINLVEHDKYALSYSKAGFELRQFLIKNTDNGKDKLLPVGIGVTGDIEIITKNILSSNNLYQYVSYGCIELAGMARILDMCGKLTVNSFSLMGMLEAFNVKADYHYYLHNSMGDCERTLALFKEMCYFVRKEV